MPIHWSHKCPPDATILMEVVAGQILVSCDAPGDPPPPPTPANASGTEQGDIGAHHWILDWEIVDGVLTVKDLDIVITLDEEIG